MLFLRGSTSSPAGTPKTQPTASKTPDVLRARQLEIVDGRGKAKIILSATDKPLEQGGGARVMLLGSEGTAHLAANDRGASVYLESYGGRSGTRMIGMAALNDEISCTLRDDDAAIDLIAGPDSMVRIKRGPSMASLAITPKTTVIGAQHDGAAIMAGFGNGLPILSGSDASGNMVFVQPTP